MFRVTRFEGEPTETDEMRPQWFELDKIPFEKMWGDDVHWYPLFLRREKFAGMFALQVGFSVRRRASEGAEVQRVWVMRGGGRLHWKTHPRRPARPWGGLPRPKPQTLKPGCCAEHHGPGLVRPAAGQGGDGVGGRGRVPC